MIRFKCEKCGQKIRTSAQFAGKKGKCPKCRSSVVVPKLKAVTAQETKPPPAKPLLNKTTASYTPQELANMSNAEIAKKLLNSKASPDAELAADEKERSFLLPHYDETSLFVMSITFILLCIVSKTMRTDLHKVIFYDSDIRLIIFFIFFFAGMLFSVFHAFSTREKTKILSPKTSPAK